MPILDNQRHELFAHGLAKGKTAEAAYKAAGYKPSRQNAHHLTTKHYIVERVAELKEMVSETVVVDRAWVLSRLIANANVKDNLSASNRALELIGKEIGMFVDRSENVNHNYTISDKPLTDEEWAGEYAQQH